MLPITLSPETAYATKPNIAFPGSQTKATAAEALAQTRINDFIGSFVDDVSVTVSSGAIEVAT